jgi:hypothetical protein
MLCFHRFVSKQLEFVAYSNGYLRIQDYAYHIIIVKAFWFDGFGNIYDLSFQQQALSAHVGSRILTVMPLGITPIALIVWFPFAFVACFNMALSYTLWITLSVSILGLALWKVGRQIFQRKRISLLPITLSVVTLISSTTFFAIILGQTSVLAAGLLIYLIFIVNRDDNEMRGRDKIIIFSLMLLLGIKPPYIALGFGLLMICEMWGEALFTAAFIILVIIGLSYLLKVEWINSYLDLVQMYSRGDFPTVYAWAIVPETMNIFRSAFRNYIGNNLSNLISNILIYSVYIGVIGFCFVLKIKSKPNQIIRITKHQLFILLVGSYLLFAPYAGGYEDVLFLPVFITVVFTGDTPNLTNYKSLLIIFSLVVILLHNYLPPNKPLWLLWILKAVILGSMVNFCGFQQPRKAGNL